jgi:hypothetical protein
MKQYIGTKLIEAEPAYRCTDNQMRVDIIVDPDEAATYYKSEEGYRVRYPDGYESWSPKETFEKAYLPLNINEELGTSAPSIGAKMVDDFIAETWTTTLGDKTTVVRAMLKNGFELVEASACVSKENYSEPMGKEICMGKIRDRVWQLLGFLLQTAVNGVK